jgi:hypothetical protein
MQVPALRINEKEVIAAIAVSSRRATLTALES